MKRQLFASFALVLALVSLGEGFAVKLAHLSTLHLPTYDADGSVSYPLPSSTVEQLAFQPQGKLIYGVGDGVIHIINSSDVTRLKSLDRVLLPDLELTHVAVCGEGVFTAYHNKSNELEGGVLVYRAYNVSTGRMELLHNIPMGSLPDMVNPTPNCTLVVAIENEAVVVDGQFYDPPGGVGIIRFPSGIAAQPEVKILNFTKFDNQFSQLSQSGVRWIYRGNGTNFSDNIEPEYIAFNTDYTTAYVSLQENNAIAVVDMTTDNITAIYGLGFKQWGELDPSDRDEGISIKPWPVYGLYQPDFIRFVRWNGQDYVITANEGDAQVYKGPVNFTEEIRGKDIDPADIASTVSEDLKEALQNDTKLGRLTFSQVDGRNSDGKFEKFCTYGARGISIWRASDMKQVYDSGSDIEKKTAEFRPDLFNNNPGLDVLLRDTTDKRSDNKGPETESLTVGEVGGRLLIVAGNERPGTIAVFSVAAGGMAPVFETLYSEGIPHNDSRTWQQIYDDGHLFALDPEYIHLFSAADGLADFPVLLVAGAMSGTVSLIKVEVEAEVEMPEVPDNDDPSNRASTPTAWFFTTLLMCYFSILHRR